MRVLFVYPNIEQNAAIPQVGISSLSACAKEAGHEISMLDYTHLDLTRADWFLEKGIKDFEPEVVALSVRSFEWQMVKQKLLPVLERHDIPVIIGGPHATAVPDDVMKEPAIYALVQGEGELVFVDFLNTLQHGGNPADIEGLHVRTAGGIKKSGVRPPQDLDALPFPDWDIWDRRHFQTPHYKKFVKNISWSGVMEMSRGCPYSCPYCINSMLKGLYRGKGKFHREKSIDRCIEEVLDKKERFGLDYVVFVDETFILKTQRVEEFCDRWIQDVKIPFRFGTRPETVTDERMRMVKEAGATVICLGIESGDVEYRGNVLKRKYSQQQLKDAVRIIQKHGMIVFGYFIMGMPYETRETLEETYKLIRDLDLDHYMISLCYPFLGTPFYDIARKEGLFHKNTAEVPNVWQDTPLSLPGLPREKLVRIRNLSSYFARRSERLRPVRLMCENHGTAYKAWTFYRKVERKIAPNRFLD